MLMVGVDAARHSDSPALTWQVVATGKRLLPLRARCISGRPKSKEIVQVWFI